MNENCPECGFPVEGAFLRVNTGWIWDEYDRRHVRHLPKFHRPCARQNMLAASRRKMERQWPEKRPPLPIPAEEQAA